jgi:acylglycerol lipase
VTVRRENGLLTGAGDVSLFWQAWLPEGTPHAAVVIAHGAGEHSGRYEHVADRLTGAGYAVHALDHRGHGRSQGPREVIDSLDRAVADLDAFVQQAGSAHPGLPVVLYGHSMGGMISISYAIAHQDRLAGLILSGPLSHLDVPPGSAQLVGAIAAVAPRLPLVKLDAKLVSRDPAVVAAYREDPLVYHGMIPARTVAVMLQTLRTFPDTVGQITIPTLIVYGTQDGLAPPAGPRMIGERIGSADITVTPYEGLYHEVHNEPEQETVLGDIVGWLDAHVGAASSAPQGA